MKIFRRSIAGAAAIVAWPGLADAQTTIDLLSDASVADKIIQLVVTVTVLSVAPGLLMIATSLPRFLIVFSFLRAGLGLQTTPSNIILINLSLFMTLFVMAPTFERAWTEGVKPTMEKAISYEEGFQRTAQPFRQFMQKHVRDEDLRLFDSLARGRGGQSTTNQSTMSDLRVLAPAFMVSELRRGFEIGFLIILPFLVIDLIVSIVVMSMGMMMMSPATFSLPCKVLFFVLIDGWNILIASLVRSFG